MITPIYFFIQKNATLYQTGCTGARSAKASVTDWLTVSKDASFLIKKKNTIQYAKFNWQPTYYIGSASRSDTLTFIYRNFRYNSHVHWSCEANFLWSYSISLPGVHNWYSARSSKCIPFSQTWFILVTNYKGGPAN